MACHCATGVVRGLLLEPGGLVPQQQPAWPATQCDNIATRFFLLHSFSASGPCCSQGFLDSKCGIIDANEPWSWPEEQWPRSVCEITQIKMVVCVVSILARALRVESCRPAPHSPSLALYDKALVTSLSLSLLLSRSSSSLSEYRNTNPHSKSLGFRKSVCGSCP